VEGIITRSIWRSNKIRRGYNTGNRIFITNDDAYLHYLQNVKVTKY
jgi:hypothetical protein